MDFAKNRKKRPWLKLAVALSRYRSWSAAIAAAREKAIQKRAGMCWVIELQWRLSKSYEFDINPELPGLVLMYQPALRVSGIWVTNGALILLFVSPIWREWVPVMCSGWQVLMLTSLWPFGSSKSRHGPEKVLVLFNGGIECRGYIFPTVRRSN